VARKGTRRTYVVRAERDGFNWLARIEGIDHVFVRARQLREIETLAREVVASAVGIQRLEFDLSLVVAGE